MFSIILLSSSLFSFTFFPSIVYAYRFNSSFCFKFALFYTAVSFFYLPSHLLFTSTPLFPFPYHSVLYTFLLKLCSCLDCQFTLVSPFSFSLLFHSSFPFPFHSILHTFLALTLLFLILSLHSCFSILIFSSLSYRFPFPCHSILHTILA